MNRSCSRFAALGAVLLALFLLTEPAFASNVLDTTMSKFHDATNLFGSRIQSAAIRLLFTLASIQLGVNILLLLLKTIELDALLSSVARWMLTTAFFYTLMHFSETWLPTILDSFELLGQQGSGLSRLTPSTILTQGIDLGNVMVSTFNQTTGADKGFIEALRNFFPAMVLVGISMITFISFVILAMQMALTMISGYLWLCITPLLLGFGGMQFTRDIAVNSLKGGIAIGMKFLVVYLIAGVAGILAPVLGESMKDVTLTDWSPLYWTQGVAMILAYLSFQLPKVAADLMNGTASLSAGDAASNVAMMAAGGVGAVAAAGGAGAALAAAGKAGIGAASSAAAGATGLVKALGAGLNAANDLGKTGISAGAHAAGQVAGHGLGMATNALGSAVSNSAGGFSKAVENSAGGKIATAIENQRGGSMSGASPAASGSSGSGPSNGGATSGSTSSAPSSATSTSSSGSTAASSGVTSGTSGGSGTTASSGAPVAGGSAPTGGSYASNASNMGPSVLPTGSAFSSTGDASTASISGGDSAPYQPLPERSGPALQDRIRSAGQNVPNDSHTVGLAANLTTHAGE